MAEPVSTVICHVPTPAYADYEVPTVTIGTDYVDGISSSGLLLRREPNLLR
jgi:hypothetical protein